MTEYLLAKSESHFDIISKLASIIWNEYYIPIIGKPQVVYMVGKFQTSIAMQQQAKEGYEYYIIKHRDDDVGYLSVKKDKDTLFLSKIYILKAFRAQKIGKATFHFIENKAKAYQCKTISLSVNKDNIDAIKAYEKMGFKNTASMMMDIGNGFFMDDYKMVKTLALKEF